MLIDGEVEYACIAKLQARLIQLDPLPNLADRARPCDRHALAQGAILSGPSPRARAMKPVAFDYERAASLSDAARLLARPASSVKPLAGGQSLGPMLNLRLAQPDLLVDITSIPELTAVTDGGDHLEIGACVTHSDIEDGRVPDHFAGLLRQVAGRIAYRAVRNRGTVGGSLAHADPAADWISALSLIGADAIVWSRKGPRTIPVADLVLSSFTTTLQADELIRAVRIPKLWWRRAGASSSSARKPASSHTSSAAS